MLCDRVRYEMKTPRPRRKWKKTKADFVLTRTEKKEALEWLIYHIHFYRCEEGHEAREAQVACTAYYQLVKDMHYEARVEAIISYCASYEKKKVKKEEARNVFLTRDQYLKVNK